MSIRKRLALGFLAILGLFAFNLAGLFFSDQRRSSTVEELRRALDRQHLISGVGERLNDLYREVDQTSRIEFAGEGLGAEQILLFDAKLDAVKQEIRAIRELTDEDKTGLLIEFEGTYDQLADSWPFTISGFPMRSARRVMA